MLKVVGFKSFADRTRLEFRPGVAVVVGPNGSGKSNLVDAIHWALGTQAPTTLRTQRMEDVIFAGTATRPALNRSEVTVVFDNNTRQLALDLDEVAITRRLYRDGTSEYEINGVACRLLDVTELLSDSGVGRHQHIIINQGQVDSILSAGPEEHRAVIEEAAGILKHKLRKARALRRLERTDDDLIRLTDILTEVSRQMKPLKRQAEAADRQGALQSEVRNLTLFLAGEELRHLDVTLDDARTRHGELTATLGEARSESIRLTAEVETNSQTVTRLRETLDWDGEAAARLETTMERLRRVAHVAAERHRNGLSRRAGADERRRDLEGEHTSLIRDAEEAMAMSEQGRAETERHEARFRLLEEQERSLADQADLSAEGALAVVQGEQRSLVAADERDRREAAQVDQRLSIVSNQLASEVESVAAIESEMLESDAETVSAQDRYELAAATRRGDQAVWEEAQAEEQHRHLEVAAASARRDAIAAINVGPADAATREMAATAQGAIGTVTSLWNVPVEWKPAVEAALGPWAEAILFASDLDLESTVRDLKAAGLGGLAVLGPESRMFAEAPSGGGRARLIEIIAALDSEIALHLLGDVVVADDWVQAWAFVQKHPGLRAVTPAGDLVTAGGIHVGQPSAEGPTKLEGAEALLAGAEVALAKAKSRVTSLKRQFDASRALERVALESLESIEARLAGTTEARGRSRRVSAELTAERGRLLERRAHLATVIADRQIALESVGQAIAALAGEEAERQGVLEDLIDRRRQIASNKESARAAWQEAARSTSAISERSALLQNRRQVVEDELAGRVITVDLDADLTRLSTIETLARQAVDILRHQIGVLRDRQAGEREELGMVDLELGTQRREATRLAGQIDELRETLNELAIVEAESRVRREAVVEGLSREIDADEEVALSTEPIAGEELSALLARRQAELRRMGPVNPLAADEHRELAERHDFMAAQLEDLQKSRNELRSVMRALDEEIQVRFNSAFEEVAAAYEDYFEVLFPGGSGRMRLTDPEEPLTSGVEIEAQPMGKKIGNLSLLSGGERSLAALAFLFGVFKARPSPFYILDEVEAALDDSNLRRFLRLVETFRGESQLVLITHQQQTMEVADVLYGVTMEPGGSSQVLSRDLATLNI